MHFKFLIGEGVNSSRDDSHFIFIETQVLDTVGIVHYIFGFLGQFGKIEMLIF